MGMKKESAEALRILLDAYGIAVRGGVITPCLNDENAFRKLIGLGPAPSEVIAEWQRTKGVRLPITLQRGLSAPESSATSQAMVDVESDGENNGN